MFPDFPVNNCGDGRTRDAVLGCELVLVALLRRIFTANRFHLFFGQPRASVSFASCRGFRMRVATMFKAALQAFRHATRCVIVTCSHPALAYLIRNIVGGGAFEEMIWPNAWRVITAVKHVQLVRIVAGCDPIGNPMGPEIVASNPEFSVTLGRMVARPLPTVTVRSLPWGLIHLGPKTISVLRGKLRKFTMRSGHGLKLILSDCGSAA